MSYLYFQIQTITMKTWKGANHELTLKIFLKNAESVIATYKGFRAHLMFRQNDAFLKKKKWIQLWVENSLKNNIIQT